MKSVDILWAFMSPRWDEKKLEEASRGLAIGSCNDPFPVRFKFWLEMERNKNEGFAKYTIESIRLISQAYENQV